MHDDHYNFVKALSMRRQRGCMRHGQGSVLSQRLTHQMWLKLAVAFQETVEMRFLGHGAAAERVV